MAFLNLHWTSAAKKRERALSPEEMATIGVIPLENPIPDHPEWTSAYMVQRIATGDEYDGFLIGFIGSCGPARVWGWDASVLGGRCARVRGQNARSRDEAVAHLVEGISVYA